MVTYCLGSPFQTEIEKQSQIMSDVCTKKGSPLSMMVMKRNEANGRLLCGMKKHHDVHDLTG